MSMLPPAPPRLALTGIVKRYGGVLANDGIALRVAPGEIHALIGENGAGKSTLMKIVYGVVAPDAGEITWDGRPVAIADPNAARRLGIGMVFQHFSLFESLTVTENIALGLGSARPLPALAAEIRQVAACYGLAVDPGRPIHHLSVGERQRVEILRCLLQRPRLLILDEPTSVLTPQEVTGLFGMLRRLAASGCSILYISHKLEEIRGLCDAATVLRAGRVVARCDPRAETAEALAEMMIGGRVAHTTRPPPRQSGPPCLVVDRLSLPPAEPFGTALRDVTLELRAGEILGIAGVAGNGQTELLAALAGERRVAPARIALEGRPIGGLGPAPRRALGLTFIPEERLGRGAVAGYSLAENALLTRLDARTAPHGLLDRRAIRALAARLIVRFGVRAAGVAAKGRSLSGGNMQKFIVGREIDAGPRVLLAAHPTWGVDIGAAVAIHQALLDLAAAGAGVLVVSEDLDELLAIADRIAVLAGGRLSPPRPVGETSIEAIGLLMGGQGTARGMADAATA
ncbi:ABC transporter ATP-binding protein [Roseicella frigidaeris]|uniref:ABC transporter ATP-binding protein n=1 Tax=Roseicella frigidaeris TaxID=2230885 RepID=A0A327MCV3_9PROT|nr:ABC transporter ATP-binding protein [Roseicella frigidaeris]RAI61041.1 ABC transporter ATP-binding protein [Roseicella frigidaeris]